jgi:hypothetical protein
MIAEDQPHIEGRRGSLRDVLHDGPPPLDDAAERARHAGHAHHGVLVVQRGSPLGVSCGHRCEDLVHHLELFVRAHRSPPAPQVHLLEPGRSRPPVAHDVLVSDFGTSAGLS